MPTDVGVTVPRETPPDPLILAHRRMRRILGLVGTPPAARPEQTRLVAVANQKGGVGKTTTAVNVAAALSLLGQRVLLIDLDPQGNASTALSLDHEPGVVGAYETLIGGAPLVDAVQPVPGLPGLFGIPATVDLAGAEIELVSQVAREARLRKALLDLLAPAAEASATTGPAAPATATPDAGRPWEDRLDYVLIDCPPSLGLLTLNALVAAHEVLIPLQSEYYALEGLGHLLGTIELVREHLNPDLTISGILLTMYDARTKLAPQVGDEVRAHFPDRLLDVTIPRSVRISEAPSYGQTVLQYDPASPGARAYLKAARIFAGDVAEEDDPESETAREARASAVDAAGTPTEPEAAGVSAEAEAAAASAESDADSGTAAASSPGTAGEETPPDSATSEPGSAKQAGDGAASDATAGPTPTSAAADDLATRATTDAVSDNPAAQPTSAAVSDNPAAQPTSAAVSDNPAADPASAGQPTSDNRAGQTDALSDRPARTATTPAGESAAATDSEAEESERPAADMSHDSADDGSTTSPAERTQGSPDGRVPAAAGGTPPAGDANHSSADTEAEDAPSDAPATTSAPPPGARVTLRPAPDRFPDSGISTFAQAGTTPAGTTQAGPAGLATTGPATDQPATQPSASERATTETRSAS